MTQLPLRTTIAAITAVISTVTATLFAAEPSHGIPRRTVIVSGIGSSEEEALRDAFRTAVRTAVGTQVDSETVTQKGSLSRRHLVTFSEGVVSSYRILEQRRVEGESQLTISAVVEKRSVPRRLHATRLASYQVDGPALFAQATTGHESQTSAETLLSKKLNRFPLDVLYVRLAAGPRIVATNDTATTVAVDLVTRVDLNRFRLLRDELLRLLQRTARENGDVLAEFSLTERQQQSRLQPVFEKRFLRSHPPTAAHFSRFWSLTRTRMLQTPSSDPYSSGASPQDLFVLVKTDREQCGEGYCWRWFRLPKPNELKIPRLKICLRFYDSAERLIREAQFPLGPDFPGWSYYQRAGQGTSLWLTPHLLTVQHGDGYHVRSAQYAKALTLTHQVRFATRELTSLHHVAVAVEDSTARR